MNFFWRVLGVAAGVIVSWLFHAHYAVAADWEVDKQASSLIFSSAAQGERFDGKFGEFTAKIHFDPAQLADANFNVTVALVSAATTNSERDEALKGEDFFAVERYPSAHYQASHFRTGNEGFIADGELSLRGATRKAPLIFTWQEKGDSATLEGHATLDRIAFGIGTGDWADPDLVAHKVEVSARLVMRRASTGGLD